MESYISSKARLYFPLLILLFMMSCSPAPTPHPPTSPPPRLTNTAPATFSPYKAGTRYADTVGDSGIPFLDVVAFRANVDDETETLEITLWMRDIPETADYQKSTDQIEYSWKVDVFLDPSRAGLADYRMGFNTSTEDPSPSGMSLTPAPELVPIYQLLVNNNIYNSNGQPIESIEGEVNPDRNTLVLKGHVPGITSRAVFSFEMSHREEITDRPDNYVPPPTTNPVAPFPEITPSTTKAVTQLVPIGTVRAYPGPEHYAGDILTFGIQVPAMFDASIPIYMTLDNQNPIQTTDVFQWYSEVTVPFALDTTTLSGTHQVKFTSADGTIDATYSFEVLPAEQRPANEIQASWLHREVNCCIFHYLSGTAGERDIEFIAEHFQKGADEYEAFMKSKLDAKMEIYVIDRMWGNGGYGGSGHIVISYTDRYYGPTVDGAGLETLARHEFSHAASISPENAGSAIDFDYEGLSVYVAGGHYKPEPLKERGAAFYDLGFSTPIHEPILQHELSYLHAALILTYITDRYGEDKVWEFLRADPNPSQDQLLPIEEAIRLTFGISLEEFERGFQAWLESNEPGDQLDDLRLTLALQDARREYQSRYAPDPLFLTAEIDTSTVTQPKYQSIVMREAHAPANVAVELMIANAQQAIVGRKYAEAEDLIQAITEVVASGNLDTVRTKEYLDIVLAAQAKGYEVVALEIQGNHAKARATSGPPELVEMAFEKMAGVWQIQP